MCPLCQTWLISYRRIIEGLTTRPRLELYMRIIFVVLGCEYGRSEASTPACISACPVNVIPVNSDNSAPTKPLDRRQNLQLPTQRPRKIRTTVFISCRRQDTGCKAKTRTKKDLDLCPGLAFKGLREAINMHQLMLG